MANEGGGAVADQPTLILPTQGRPGKNPDHSARPSTSNQAPQPGQSGEGGNSDL